MNTPIVSPSFLKQIAKRLKREQSLSQARALDEAAKLHGYANYKHYLNALEAKELSKHAHWGSIFSEKDASAKVGFAISFIQEFRPSFQRLLEILEQFQSSEEDLKSVCDQADFREEIEEFLWREFSTDDARIEIESSHEFFVAKNLSSRNLVYEFREDALIVSGDYDLELAFDGEIPPDYKDYPHFKPRFMFGDFEITFDRDNGFAINHSSIGEDIDGQYFSKSFL